MRETTKIFTGGTRTRIVGGNITQTTGGNHVIWAKGNIEISSNKSIIMSGGEKGITYGDYVPPEEYYTTHPRVEKVEFFDQNNKLLNQNTKDFYYGQKLKIKVTTKDAKNGELIYLTLQGKSKSKNQKFDMMNGSGFRWGFVPIKDNKYETPLFELNPNWYSDDLETYDYDQHLTKIKEEDLNEFYVKVNLDAKMVFFPLEGQRLKPIAYKRNYEELIGLFNTDNSGSKDLLTNYENKFIDKYKEKNDAIKDIVDGFSEYLCEDNRDLTIEEISTKVVKSAKKLWDYAVWQHKDHTSTTVTTIKKTGEKKEEIKEIGAIADDRPLYWARIAMQVILKRQYAFIEDIKKLPQKDQDGFFIKSIVPKSSKLWEVIQLFEENSRNYTGIDFSKAGSKKKVLITGFDPFLLNSINHQYKTSFNILQSNPSGVVALALANNQTLGAYIQTMIVPVRYTDFDGSQEHDKGQGEGIIEKYIKPFINQVDMIITISQSLPDNYHIDVFATASREGFNDNMDFIRIDESKSTNEPAPETIVTTLPLQFSQGNSKAIFYGNYHLTKLDKQIKSVKYATKESYPTGKVYNGPGGNYLSNEIFYRVAKLRAEQKSTLPTGHFHISMIQETGDLIPNKIKDLLETIKQSLTEGIKGI